MIVVDLINDEAPLFVEGICNLLNEKFLNKDQVLGVTEGTRWRKESRKINCFNRLNYFDEIENRGVDIEAEILRISKAYNNFNIYACDRYLIKEERSLQRKLLVFTYLFYEEVFKNNVTHYFTTGIAYTYNLVSYEVSKKFNVKHVSFYGIRLKNKTAISLGITNSFDEVNDLYSGFKESLVTDSMHAYIAEFVNKPKQPSYMNNAVNASGVKWVFVKEFFDRVKRHLLKNKHRYDFFTRNPFESASFKLKKIFNAKKINFLHNKIFDRVDYSDKYFIFPLHMQPEASTLVLAPFYVDQKCAIVNISKNLPLDTLLYVKEHKSALGQHSLSFYNELKKYPNIKLISYKENTFELIKNCLATINLSSTVGLESLFMKKPSIVLGDVFYKDSGLTFNANSFSEFKIVIDKLESISYNVESFFSNYNNKLAYFLYCLDKKSYPFEFDVAKLDTKQRVLKDENVIEFTNCIKQIIAYP